MRARRGELAGDLRDSGAAGDAREEDGRTGKGRCQVGSPGQRERENGALRDWAERAARGREESRPCEGEKRGEWSAGKGGRVSGEERERERVGLCGGKEPAQGGEGGQVGLPSLISFPFSFSNPF
jgi:hypothetical protein